MASPTWATRGPHGSSIPAATSSRSCSRRAEVGPWISGAMSSVAGAAAADPRRWRMLAIVAFGVLLAMAPWFSSSAVAPLLTAEWGLDRLALPALTIAVQLGFAAGALLLAITAAA